MKDFDAKIKINDAHKHIILAYSQNNVLGTKMLVEHHRKLVKNSFPLLVKSKLSQYGALKREDHVSIYFKVMQVYLENSTAQ